MLELFMLQSFTKFAGKMRLNKLDHPNLGRTKTKKQPEA